MSEPALTLIWAMTENGVIGDQGDLPWHLPDDLKHFKLLTSGRPVIMGRTTWESLPVQPLPGRRNIVLTSNPDYEAEGAEVVHSLEHALSRLEHEEQACVIGGASVYAQAMDRADRLEVTIIHTELEGDTTMPSVDPARWTLIAADAHAADDRHDWPFTFQTWERSSI
ncbi:MAG: dihydrofolate reductase [Acidimicrobiales bacterium]